MKPDQLYQALKDLADKLQITVSEQNLKIAGVKVKSGLCKVKGKRIYVMDKHKSLHRKNVLLARCLNTMALEDIYVVPAVRDFLTKTGSG